MSKILSLKQRRPEAALKNLNRLTGLDFQSWPESLLDQDNQAKKGQQTGDDLDEADFPQRVSQRG